MSGRGAGQEAQGTGEGGTTLAQWARVDTRNDWSHLCLTSLTDLQVGNAEQAWSPVKEKGFSLTLTLAGRPHFLLSHLADFLP